MLNPLLSGKNSNTEILIPKQSRNSKLKWSNSPLSETGSKNRVLKIVGGAGWRDSLEGVTCPPYCAMRQAEVSVKL